MAVVLATGLVLSACGSGDDSAEPARIAFLRVVPGQTIDALLGALAAAGFAEGEGLELIQDDPLGEVHVTAEEASAAVRRWADEGVDLIYAFSSGGTAAASAATSEVPIVFLLNDPVVAGLVEDPLEPGRNLTGVTYRVPADRTIAVAQEALPGLDHIGVLRPESDPAGPSARAAAVEAARAAGLTVSEASFQGDDDGGEAAAVAELAAEGVDAILVVNTPTSVRRFAAIESAATPLQIPLVANTSFAQGAVVILEPDTEEVLIQLGRQGARLLGGAKVSEIPVEDPRRFRLVLNAAQASLLGLGPLDDALVRMADEVIR